MGRINYLHGNGCPEALYENRNPRPEAGGEHRAGGEQGYSGGGDEESEGKADLRKH